MDASTPDRSKEVGLALRRPRYEVVHKVLADNIETGAIAEGTVLRERDVSEIFNIGRMPVSIALKQLEADGLVHRRHPMHGLVVGSDRTRPLAARTIDVARLQIPEGFVAALKLRNWRTLLYKDVERDVASCLLFGRFQIKSQSLAEHFGVSRTIAHELLLRLERFGLVQQESNARWYAGPLTAQRIKDLYEMRILLEPHALRQSAGRVSPSVIREKLARVVAAEALEARSDVTLLHRLETDLHQDIVLECTNEDLRGTLYRCQLPLITTHLSFGSYGEEEGIPQMVHSHRKVLELLAEGAADAAAGALQRHLEESSGGYPHRLSGLRPLDSAKLSSYLDPV